MHNGTLVPKLSTKWDRSIEVLVCSAETSLLITAESIAIEKYVDTYFQYFKNITCKSFLECLFDNTCISRDETIHKSQNLKKNQSTGKKVFLSKDQFYQILELNIIILGIFF